MTFIFSFVSLLLPQQLSWAETQDNLNNRAQLPVIAAPAIYFLIDKSKSADKLLAAITPNICTSVETLTAKAKVGVIAFDQAPFQIIKLQPQEQFKTVCRKRLKLLVGAGTTNLLPSLQLARIELTKISSARKHIILVTDAKFSIPKQLLELEANKLLKQQIRVSVITLTDGDTKLLRNIAELAGWILYASSLNKELNNFISYEISRLQKLASNP